MEHVYKEKYINNENIMQMNYVFLKTKMLFIDTCCKSRNIDTHISVPVTLGPLIVFHSDSIMFTLRINVFAVANLFIVFQLNF